MQNDQPASICKYPGCGLVAYAGGHYCTGHTSARSPTECRHIDCRNESVIGSTFCHMHGGQTNSLAAIGATCVVQGCINPNCDGSNHGFNTEAERDAFYSRNPASPAQQLAELVKPWVEPVNVGMLPKDVADLTQEVYDLLKDQINGLRQGRSSVQVELTRVNGLYNDKVTEYNSLKLHSDAQKRRIDTQHECLEQKAELERKTRKAVIKLANRYGINPDDIDQ